MVALRLANIDRSRHGTDVPIAQALTDGTRCMYNLARFCPGRKMARADVRNPSFPSSRRRLMEARGLSGEVNAWRIG